MPTKGDNVESYIVRIYRRDKKNRDGIIGIVEIVSRKKKAAFKNFDELKMLLNPAKKSGYKIYPALKTKTKI